MATLIKTKSGEPVPTCSLKQLQDLQAWQHEHITVSESRIVEAASFSFAMVIRYALGLTAAGGTIGALVRDSRAGHVVVATLRHLLNAGAAGVQIVVINEPGTDRPDGIGQSKEMAEQLLMAGKLGANIFDYEPSGNNEDFEQLLKGCHNLLVGTFSPERLASDATILPLIEVLNEFPTPGHCIDMPFGVDPDTGLAGPGAMFASSTLSLGIPLSGCLVGSDHLGRHYAADCGFALEQYRELGYTGPSLFADQPVVQLVHE